MLGACVFAAVLLSANAQTQNCTAKHSQCGDCVKDPGCGWCTGDIGGGNPGQCVADSVHCDTIFLPDTCPDCHKPWIRFAHTFATTNTITCEVSQGNKSRTWSDFAFGQFSNWTQDFDVGQGTVTISSSGKTLVTANRLLTPGPLIITVKESPAKPGWPPSTDDSVETIAASYAPIPEGSSGVRLFDLSFNTSNTAGIGFSAGGKQLASGIKYSLGSEWVQVPLAKQQFDVTDAAGATLGSITYAPPPRGANTLFVIGNKGGAPDLTIKEEVDAPYVCSHTMPPTPLPTPAPPVPTPAPQSCIADIMFAMDGSCSIKHPEWLQEKQAVKSISDSFTFGTGNGTGGNSARMGMVQFGWTSTVEQTLTGDQKQFDAVLANMPQRTKHCETRTADGLNDTKNVFDSNKRPNTNYRATIVITDGIPQPTDQLQPALQVSQAMQSENIEVFAVYICGGKGKDNTCGKGKTFMDQLASKPSSKYSLTVSNWNSVQSLIKSILASVCGKTELITTTLQGSSER